jgi:hypothetical protein
MTMDAAGFRVEEGLHGTSFILPPRHIEKGRSAGMVVLVFGLVVTGFMCAWMYGPLSSGLGGDGPMQWFSIVFGLLGTPGLLVGLALVFGGLAIMLNLTHAEVVVDRETIWSVERCGRLAWKRKRPVSAIERLVVMEPISARSGNGPARHPLGRGTIALRAEGPAIKSLLLAPGYPEPMVRALAARLSDLMEGGRTQLVSDHRTIEVVEEPPADEATETGELPLYQPPDSTAEYAELKNGISIVVPPSGLWKGSKGLFFFSILWNGFISVFAVVMVKSVLGGSNSSESPWVLLFLLPFIAVGLGILYASINMGRRRVFLAVMDGVLAYRRVSPIKIIEQKLRADEISAICMGPSGMSVNDVPVMELQIHRKQGKKIGMLSQRENAELKWIAQCLRRALGVPRRAP